ncbi:AsmA family protein [Algoriphagus marinus]|uniref:DUF748 domain-containing protein n=1 Tax=Algoriphagus marinus TaxID=1925762 RepID=UPI00094BA799|nr:DUF748 domain-containing protein [Algoriphagus marinus]
MKKILIGFLIATALLLVASFGLEAYFEKRISEAINTNPDRAYDILFEDISISLFRRKASLKRIRLVSLKDSEAIKVSGSLQSIELSGVDFLDLIFNRRLSIYRLELVDPGFKLTRKDIQGRPEDNSKALQDVFKDIISRGLIQNFELVNGTAEFFVEQDSLIRFAQFTDLNISANGIVSDSVIVQNPVPFQLESIQMSLKNLNVITDVNQKFKLGELRFDSKTESILIKDISLEYDNWEETANSLVYQQDVIELTIQTLSLTYLNAKNNISGDWQIAAGLAEFRGLSLDDYRDKNKPRPEEPEKPLFEGLVEKIPFPIELDTIRILDSKLVYREFLPGKSTPGILSFENLSAEILNVISTDSLQGDSEMKITANALFHGVAEIDLGIQVPYGKNSFSLQAGIKKFELSEINKVLEQMANVRVETGELLSLQLQMEASRYTSSNQLNFQYENLKLKILDEGKSVNKLKSSLANIFTSKNNLASDPNYKTATYRSKRNIYRGPLNLVWLSTKDGLIQIVPGEVAQLFLDK